ncbi:MAG: STAS domain-containing protein [Desulfobacterales bacterium]|nr:STAS domain-containing protein [Desulfobacterales bacterium]
MAVKTQISTDGKVCTISITGRFDITTHKDFSGAYKDKLDSVSKWIIDMADVDYMDSSALGMLLMLRERAGGNNAEINIVNCSPGVKKILITANFDKLFPMF